MSVITLAPPPADQFELRPPELINLAGQDTGRDHISHSSIGTFLRCEQLYEYHYEDRLEPAVTAAPLALGRAFAHSLEHGDPVAGEMLLRKAADEEYTRSLGNPWVAAPDEQTVETQATIVREASRAYLNAYGRHETREVEQRVRIRNPQVGGRYSQTHDLVCRIDAVSQDGTELFEDKLVGQIPRADLARKVRLDRQVSIEAYTLWRTTGQLVQRVRYRMTLKPAIRQTKKETFDEYLTRIGTEYATRPEHYLVEEIAYRDTDDFLRLERELWRWAERVRESRRDGTFPRNTGACLDMGGCKFMALCSGEPGAEHQYVVRPEFVESERPEEVAA